MKIHLGWIRTTASAAIVAGMGIAPAAAQYVPYRPMPQQQAAQQAPATAQPLYMAYQPQAPRSGSPTYPSTTSTPYQPSQSASQYSPYGQTTAAYPQTAAAYPQTATQYPTSPAYGAYPYMAQQPTELPAPNQNAAPNTAPANGAPNGHGHSMQNGNTSAAVEQGANGYQQGCGCNGANAYTGGSYHNGAACGCDNGCSENYGISSYFDDDCSHSNQWFGGVYGLFMQRDDPSPVKLTVSVPDAATYPYYPTAAQTVLVQPDYDFRAGVEVRFGSTFMVGDHCDACDTGCNNYGYGYNNCNSCNSCAPPPTLFAWEVAWWGLDDDENSFNFVEQTGYGVYGMVNFAGLVYDYDNTGYDAADTSVNGYYGYQLPIPASSDLVLAQRVRTNFQAQNLELNIIRFPVCDMSCGGCNSGCGCDSGCNTGCDPCGCEPACTPLAFSMCGSCGVRYFRMDDDFFYGTEFEGGGQTDYNGWTYDNQNELFYNVEVENNLIGPQLGWMMNYCYGCKWNFFLNSTFGVFENHIEHNQQMRSGGGGWAYFAQSGERFEVSSDKDDIAFLGELRLGGSYDITCNWRAVLAYRAVAMTGIATSTDQIADDFTNAEYVGIIDSDSSAIVHGVQSGVECRY